MEPKISIIIPVYNVEEYLPECLDSVINQTMREIQIICVNDGSSDNSLAILQEYAGSDSRVKIIDKPNGGQATARNAAYPYIKGKYTLFVDSDDWIELDLCEKAYQKGETTNAEVVLFFFFTEISLFNSLCQSLSISDKKSVEEKLSVIEIGSACCKLFRTDFLFNNNIRFPEGLMYEDTLFSWQTTLLPKMIAMLPERLYHYRQRTGSTTRSVGEHSLHLVPIYDLIRNFLLESGYYESCRNHFISTKLNLFFYYYLRFPPTIKHRFAAKIRESLSTDERSFYRSATNEQLEKSGRLFFAMIDGGGIIDITKYHWSRFAYFAMPRLARVPGVRFIVRNIMRPLLKRILGN